MRLINTADGIGSALAELEHAQTLYLDTEFHTERTYYPELYLLQLRGDRGLAWLFDPTRVSLAPLTRVFLTKPVVVHGGQQDVGVLKRLLGVVPKIGFETQLAAAFLGAGWPRSLGQLTERFLGRPLAKGATLSDWSRRPLTPAQLAYAAEDVLVLPDLVDALKTGLHEQGREAMYEDALLEWTASAITDPDPTTAWTNVGGARGLDAPGRACLAALAAWRETQAQDRNISRNALASDGVLLDLARRRPESVEGLRANRRLPGHLARQEAETLLELIAGATEAPPPLPDVGPTELLRGLSRPLAARVGVAAEWLLPEAQLRKRHYAEGLKAWRKDLLGPDFLAFIEGKSAYRIPAEFLDATIS